MALASRRVLHVLAALWLTCLASCAGKKDINFVGGMCPNGKLDKGEECDDNNANNGDGCSSTCTIEPGWTCSGTPSVCVRCGNGKREGTEQCDDSNNTDGDGCSAKCQIEGSCTAPKSIVLDAAPDGDGLIGRAQSATGATDLPQVPAGACGTKTVGSGPDRVFEVDLPSTADLLIHVTASFGAVVRVMTSPCALKDQVVGGCRADATSGPFVVPSLAPGKYYIAVGSNASTQSGPFQVDVSARCPLENVRIDRVVLDPPYRTHIVNTNDCSVSLDRIGIYSQPQATDAPSTLPAQLLPPRGRRILTSQAAVPAGQTYQGNIPYDTTGYAGAFYLCRDVCNTNTGDNVYDAFSWMGTSGAPPAGPSDVQFDVNATALDNRVQKAYYRILTNGKFPTFKAADYVAAYFADTFEDGTLDGWTPPANTFYTTAFESPAGTIGKLALSLKGGNPNGVWDGPKFPLVDNSGAPMSIQPRSVSLWVRTHETTLAAGYVFFGQPGSEDGAFGGEFRATGTFGFGSPVVINTPSYSADAWYHVEYKNISWTASTADVFVGGQSQGTLTMSLTNISQISVQSLVKQTPVVWLDQIIVN